MTDRAFEIVEKRLATCTLKVFENEDGTPWTASAINCRFNRLKKRSGTKHFAYSIRHGFATRKLVEGHDHLTVAELLGHANGQMVSQVYSHMNRADEHLRKALNGPVEPKVVGVLTVSASGAAERPLNRSPTEWASPRWPS
jgi:site-specific recombinase XerD